MERETILALVQIYTVIAMLIAIPLSTFIFFAELIKSIREGATLTVWFWCQLLLMALLLGGFAAAIYPVVIAWLVLGSGKILVENAINRLT